MTLHCPSKIGNQTFSLFQAVVRSLSLVRAWTIPPSFFIVGELLCLVHPFFCYLFILYEWRWYVIYLLFAVPQCPHLKKRYHDCVEKVKEYLETVKDFDKLVSPQSLFLHFLGSKPSSKVWKNLEVVKKSECSFFFFFFFFFFSLSLSHFNFYNFSFLSGMTTRSSK